MVASDASRHHRFFFVHIMKTGGTAFVRLLRNHFGRDAVYPSPGVDGTGQTEMWGLYLRTDRLRERVSARGDQIQVITGHFPLYTTELIDGRFTTLTLLRDPVERALSMLRGVGRYPLEEAYDEFLGRTLLAMGGHPAFDPQDNMTKMLGLSSDEMRAVPGDIRRVDLNRDHLERAKQALAGMGAVGLQEHFEDFCSELTARFSWDLGKPEIVNSTPTVEVRDTLRQRIAEDNRFDIELYEFARELIRDRRGSAATDG